VAHCMGMSSKTQMKVVSDVSGVSVLSIYKMTCKLNTLQ
jgi:hypothetical protein